MLSRLVLKGLGRLAVASLSAGVRVGTALARAASPDHFACETCGYEIPTTGLYQCPCGFSYYGDYWAPCRNCAQCPSFLACPRCSASNLNPFVR